MTKSGFSPEDVKPTPPVPEVAKKPVTVEAPGGAQAFREVQMGIENEQKAEREAFRKLQDELAAEPSVVPAQTMVTSPTTPTASTDPRKKLLRPATRPE